MINSKIIVDIGVNKYRYLTRMYHINPSIMVITNKKLGEILIGDVSINDVSKLFEFICPDDKLSLTGFDGVESLRVVIWQCITV